MAFLSDLSVFSKRDASICSDSEYTTPNGLSFAMHCDTNIPLSDFAPTTTIVANDVYDCLGICSKSRPRCYGVAFTVASGACWLKNASITDSSMSVSDAGTHSAVVNPASQLNNTDTTCPYNNGSPQLTDNGLNFTIHCNQDFAGGDYFPNQPIDNSTGWPFHTTSLSECMKLCSDAHPLCTGVSYNPDMIMGYANCYLKNNTSVGFKLQSAFVVHSAEVNIANLTSNCTTGSKATSNGKTYNLSCNENQGGNDILIYHDTSLDKCLSTCATWTSGGHNCVGVVFDAYMEMGWENCYLKNATSRPLYNSSATLALLSTAQNSSSGSGGSGGGGSSSKVWIAGPVVGGIVALVAIAATAAYCARRRRRTGPGPEAYEGHWQAPQYSASSRNTKYAPTGILSSGTAQRPAEMADTQIHQIGSGE